MSGDEDDYLSDKFLAADSPSAAPPKTYAQLRKEVQRKAQLKNEQNRTKGRRQRELEAREEGLSKSLFERAKEEEDAGISSGNKALSMMMKMGFKPGQSLGKIDEPVPAEVEAKAQPDDSQRPPGSLPGHIVKPIPLNEWTGKKGIGLGKRARSPSSSADRVAKMAKMAKETEEISHQDFRNRARREYEEKRAQGRLGPAQRTCITLDEQAGKPFHVLWLNSDNPDSLPDGLMDSEALRGAIGFPREQHGEPIQVRLRKQMQADALRPLEGTDSKPSTALAETFSSEVVEEALQFLRLQSQDRLSLVLAYLRDVHEYCFWCGVQYDDQETMENQCPGPDEESHD